MKRISLEPAADQVCEQNSEPPLIFQLPPEEGRKVLEQVQDSPVRLYPASVKTISVRTGKWGAIPVHCILPECLTGTPGVILYLHGAGWVFGSLHTHKKLVHELAARTNSILIFPEYTRAPEARYPAAIEQCYAVLCMLPKILARFRSNACLDTLTVAGDSAGGNIAISLALLAKFRGGPHIHKQLLYYPVTNACFQTRTYQEFACGYSLYRQGMMWFWDCYAPCEEDRREITASPLRAAPEDLRGLPDTCILNGEADVLRDEGEAFACRLREAGVDVTAMRFPAIIHDFVMLNALDQTNACRAAMDVSTDWISRKNRRESR